MRFRNHHAGCCGFNPTRPDGSEWAHLLTLHDGSTVHADTAAEVVEELVPGYTSLPDAARAAARIRIAERLATASQEARIQAAVARGALDPADPDQAALLDILRADKGQSMLLETEDAPGDQADWLPEPTLVLVASRYAPHTDHDRIGGNVVYLDPSSDEALLASLRDAQIFDYWASGA
nr:hypothetical protein [Propionibacterium sp.]